jgi:hypothetical protein
VTQDQSAIAAKCLAQGYSCRATAGVLLLFFAVLGFGGPMALYYCYKAERCGVQTDWIKTVAWFVTLIWAYIGITFAWDHWLRPLF